jgi:hypothetical protein
VEAPGKEGVAGTHLCGLSPMTGRSGRWAAAFHDRGGAWSPAVAVVGSSNAAEDKEA